MVSALLDGMGAVIAGLGVVWLGVIWKKRDWLRDPALVYLTASKAMFIPMGIGAIVVTVSVGAGIALLVLSAAAGAWCRRRGRYLSRRVRGRA